MEENNHINKKRLLFIGVGFRNYDKLIANELSKRYDVVCINSKEYDQHHRVLSMLARKYCKKWLEHLCAKHIMRQIREKAVDIDKVFVVKGEHLTSKHLEYIKQQNKIEKIVLYLWDKWSMHENIDIIKSHFDDIYSFDTKDCEEQGVKLRPLFYFDDQIKLRQRKLIDVSFVGNDHTGRYELLRRVKHICQEKGLRYKFCLLIGKVEYTKFARFPFLKSRYAREDAEMFNESGISYTEYIDIISSSNVVIDMPYEGQTGLTMRTIEALAMGARLITSNEAIAKYRDISPESYLIINHNTKDEDILSYVTTAHGKDFELTDRYECGIALKEMI